MNSNKLKWYIPFLIPIFGVLFFNWNPFSIIFFFSLESLVIGVFLALKGLISIFYTRKFKGIMFLLSFCLIYFVHLVFLILLTGGLGEYFGEISISYSNFLASIITLLILKLIEVIYLLKAFKADNPLNKEDTRVMLDFLFDFKETMFKVFILWFTLIPVYIIIFINSLYNYSYRYIPSILIGAFIILIFIIIRNWVELRFAKERVEAFKSL